MAERIVHARGVDLCIEEFGAPSDPTLLLISGLGATMDWWDRELCERLAAERRHVVRYDHRDTGRSSHDPPGRPSYGGHDLVVDPLAILDALGVERAHVVGVSMGGAIAQQLAAQHPDRVATITVVATSPAGERRSGAELPWLAVAVGVPSDGDAEPDWDDPTAVIDHLVEEQRALSGGIGFDEARIRDTATQAVTRTLDVRASLTNHWLLEDDDGDRFRMDAVAVPVLVVHGSDDPLFPLDHGRAIADEIPHARLVVFDGMGHEVPPPPLWDRFVAAVVDHTGPSSGGAADRPEETAR
jgi:pimeloyl-ACP methyl ester carboxylesterase